MCMHFNPRFVRYCIPQLYDPVFKRNARFAVKKPVPEMGDENTPMSEVYKFYEYWINFESWRDFTGVGAEHKVDDSMSRDERRYRGFETCLDTDTDTDTDIDTDTDTATAMRFTLPVSLPRYYAKENEANEKKLKKKEMSRLINMVMLAEKFDPRIAADKEKKRAAKEAEKGAKEASTKQRAELDAASKAWAQQLEEQAKEALPKTKEEKEKIKKKASTARNSLRKLLRLTAAGGHGSGEYGIATEADVEVLCGNCELEELNVLLNALGGDAAIKDPALLKIAGGDDVVAMIARMKGKAGESVEDERIAKDAKKRETLEAAVSKKKQPSTPGKGEIVVPDRDWTGEELSDIHAAMQRYPAHLANRWQLIAYYVNDKILPADGVPPAVMSVGVDDILRAAYTNFK